MQSDLSNRSSSVRKGETATCLTDRSPVIALKWQFSHIFANTSLFSRLLRQGAWIFLKESHIAEHGETNENWFKCQEIFIVFLFDITGENFALLILISGPVKVAVRAKSN